MCIYIHTPHRQRWLFSSTSTYHSTELLTARGVAHPVVHGTSGSTSCKTIPPVRSDSSGDVLSTVDMVVQRRDGPRRLRNHDDDDDLYQGTGTETGTGGTTRLRSEPEPESEPLKNHRFRFSCNTVFRDEFTLEVPIGNNSAMHFNRDF